MTYAHLVSLFFINLCVHYGTYRVELLISIHIFCALGFVSPSVSRCLFVCYRSWCVTWLTNTTSATWHTARNLQSLNQRRIQGLRTYTDSLTHTQTGPQENILGVAAELNASASADDLALTVIIGDDRVLSSAPLDIWRRPTCKSLELQMWLRLSPRRALPHSKYILLLHRRPRVTAYTQVYACREDRHTDTAPTPPHLAHAYTLPSTHK